MRIAAIVVLLAACGAPAHSARWSEGSIAGLARDHDSGDPIARALIQIRRPGQSRPFSTVSSDRGDYNVPHLRPGRYELLAIFAGQPVGVRNIDVRAGEATVVDLAFTLGRPDRIDLDNADANSAIQHYLPPNLGPTVSVIEGTITDVSTRERVPGAVVTAVTAGNPQGAEQTISDDQGRFRFDPVAPGTYTVSAYYSITGRGQVDVRRSDITVAAAQAVVVPLSIEMVR